jgi:flagellar motor switch protein FliN/FliY
LASDLSNIIKEELANTLEQLLSNSSSVEEVKEANGDDVASSQCIEGNVKFEFKDISSKWQFYVPTITATKFEYLMLGGMGDLKEHIDDEITDAVNEIISNICGSISTSINAQGFPDVSGIKNEMEGSSIVEGSVCKDKANLYEFALALGEEKLSVLIAFDETILPFIGGITGKEVESPDMMSMPEEPSSFAPATVSAPSSSNGGMSSLLSDDSSKNLKLLFDIKLKLSVRLGTKVFLLKDILRWDVGEIIELEQMVNEPLEVLVNGVKIGEGEAVIVEGKFGLKIKSIGSGSNRLSQIGL